MNKKDLQSLILETYAQVTEAKGIKKLSEVPDAFVAALKKKYGEVSLQNDFLSPDLTTYYKYKGTDKTTGEVDHAVINLPSFYSLYDEFSNIIQDIKTLMRNQDIQRDQAAKDLFEEIRTIFRRLQSYLRKERPDQYQVIRDRKKLYELHGEFVKQANLLLEAEEVKPEEEGDPKAPKDTVLEDATDTILGRFPTLKQAIIKLQTEEFKEFVSSIDWISPRPTAFRINIKNGQDYILKWTGKTFEAQILGKRYLLSNISDYQQALDKLSLLYREGPMADVEDPAEPLDTSTSGGGGGDFPGGEGGAGDGEEPGAEAPAAGGEEGGGADLSSEPVDFEAGEEPEA